jgi:hypothetical protein
MPHGLAGDPTLFTSATSDWGSLRKEAWWPLGHYPSIETPLQTHQRMEAL